MPCPPSRARSQPPLNLRLRSNADRRFAGIVHEINAGLPRLKGRPIFISTRPHLKASRGRLLSGIDQPGTPVHAASFIRRREIILETQLLAHPHKLRLILAHEVFHFVWARLGNPCRQSFARLIDAELAAHSRGDLGESSSAWKHRHLKNYICESFCDTAAWLHSGVRQSSEFSLAKRWKTKRRRWWQSVFHHWRSQNC